MNLKPLLAKEKIVVTLDTLVSKIILLTKFQSISNYLKSWNVKLSH